MTPLSDRELDALVAEKIFGYRLNIVTINESAKFYSVRGTDSKWRSLLKYSTDIAAAWQIVGKLCADGWKFSINRYGLGIEAACAFYTDELHLKDPVPDTWGHGATIELAICRAALKTVNHATPE